MFRRLLDWIYHQLVTPPPPLPAWQGEWSDFLRERVTFYRNLSAEEQALFNLRMRHFWSTTRIEASEAIELTDEDRLLVGASAIIPVWGLPDWHYMNVAAVFLLPGLFNNRFQCGQPDSRYSGMVGSGPMAGKLVLSKPDLHAGFANSEDKRNVGIHEFVHLLDMADGVADGFPERLAANYACSRQWSALIQDKIGEMGESRIGIDSYASTNPAEFFAVTSEYFFERPELLQKKHPQLYQWLADFYQQNRAQQVRQLRAAEAALRTRGRKGRHQRGERSKK